MNVLEKLKKYAKKYFIDAMSAMALGLFASLLIGTIFGTVGTYLGPDYISNETVNAVGTFFTEMKTFAQGASGMAIGVAIAYSLKVDPLVMFSCAAVGSLSYSLGATISLSDGSTIAYTAGPAGAYVAAIIACEIGMLVSKKTKVDILVTPTVTIISGYAVAKLVCPAIAYIMYWLGDFINTATEMQPLIMGIIIAVVVGMILTLPISSAAICAMIGISGIAGGAATAGCCAQMIGFAVISFADNGWGGFFAQGLGTSMLQMSNIIKKPLVWIPPTLASAFCGPISTLVFKLECTGVSAGMGTCGLVGPLGTLTDMGGGANMWMGMLLCYFILPAVLSYLFYFVMKKMGIIKDGDMKLQS
ncbi:MAG: PTS sugar transporter subunit IIC [Oscillospiraceae bacterium]|nr:PTS sugar transporter subunit IIC [Oscillospiraceae bacterium]